MCLCLYISLINLVYKNFLLKKTTHAQKEILIQSIIQFIFLSWVNFLMQHKHLIKGVITLDINHVTPCITKSGFQSVVSKSRSFEEHLQQDKGIVPQFVQLGGGEILLLVQTSEVSLKHFQHHLGAQCPCSINSHVVNEASRKTEKVTFSVSVESQGKTLDCPQMVEVEAGC